MPQWQQPAAETPAAADSWTVLSQLTKSWNDVADEAEFLTEADVLERAWAEVAEFANDDGNLTEERF